MSEALGELKAFPHAISWGLYQVAVRSRDARTRQQDSKLARDTAVLIPSRCRDAVVVGLLEQGQRGAWWRCCRRHLRDGRRRLEAVWLRGDIGPRRSRWHDTSTKRSSERERERERERESSIDRQLTRGACIDACHADRREDQGARVQEGLVGRDREVSRVCHRCLATGYAESSLLDCSRSAPLIGRL